jgi:spermidine synthase
MPRSSNSSFENVASADPVAPARDAGPRSRQHLLASAFFVSGAAGLVLEVLWFRQAGLAFGNGVWASSLVLSSFMAGLALGNAAATRWGPRVARPLLGYALAEAAIAVAGPLLVWLLPRLSGLLRPFTGVVDADPVLLNGLRFAASFFLLAGPATAMGLTFPLVVRAAGVPGSPLGTTLGRLYGWNTLGAVAGASLTELVLVPRFGVSGSALLAASFNVAAALCGAWLAFSMPRFAPRPVSSVEPDRRPFRPTLLAAALAGGLLLALEVLWFRSLVQLVVGSSLAFALMLAVVLTGIALGGFVASALCRFRRTSLDAVSALLLCGTATSLAWFLFPQLLRRFDTHFLGSAWETIALGASLMVPTSVLSGVAFTLIGDIVGREESTDPARASGRLALWNTGGALLGSPLAAFVLLPLAGVDASILVVSSAYGVAALLVLANGSSSPPHRAGRVLSVASFVGALVLVTLRPSGDQLLSRALTRFGSPPTVRPILVNEGVNETVVVLEYRLLDEPVFHRLVTNGFSMSGTWFRWERYMKSFVYLPVALHPSPREALLICFGVGSTASALVETPELTRIDVVDISAEVLDASRAIYRDGREDPLSDPRVHVRVEDGRYVLSSARRSWDIITAEPPPPQAAGVANLYTREYFQLVRDRLAPGGISTHWLPVHSLPKVDALAIIRAYCDTFEDCTLWNGSGSDWVLLGSRGGLAPASPARIAAGFTGEGGRERARLGFELPEQLGATFIADAATLAQLTRGVEPLVDDFPRRLSERFPAAEDQSFFLGLQQPAAAQPRFLASAFCRDIWPAELKDRMGMAFSAQDVIKRTLGGYVGEPEQRLEDLVTVLTRSDLRTLPFWILGSAPEEEKIARKAAARGVRGADVDSRLAAGELSRREYLSAAERYRTLAASASADSNPWRELQVVALALAGRREEAESVIDTTGTSLNARLTRMLGLGAGEFRPARTTR